MDAHAELHHEGRDDELRVADGARVGLVLRRAGPPRVHVDDGGEEEVARVRGRRRSRDRRAGVGVLVRGAATLDGLREARCLRSLCSSAWATDDEPGVRGGARALLCDGEGEASGGGRGGRRRRRVAPDSGAAAVGVRVNGGGDRRGRVARSHAAGEHVVEKVHHEAG